MGLGGFFKGLGKGALGFVTGGPMGAIQGVASALGGGASAAKEGRMDEATLQAQMNSRNNLDALNAAQFNQRAQGDLMRRALMAKMLGQEQGPRDPRQMGGPSMSPALQALMARYGGQAEGDLAGGGYRVNPTMSSIPKSGVMERAGGIAGTIGGLLGALGSLKRPAPVASGAPQTGPLSANVKKPGLEDLVL